MKTLEEIAQTVVVGKQHKVSLSHFYCGTVHQVLTGVVHSIDKHSDYSYSIFLVTENGAGYYWIVPRWMKQFAARIVDIELLE